MVTNQKLCEDIFHGLEKLNEEGKPKYQLGNIVGGFISVIIGVGIASAALSIACQGLQEAGLLDNKV